MRYEVIGKNVKVTSSMEAAILKKLGRIEKYFINQNDVKCLVVASTEKEVQTIEITIFTKHMTMRAEISEPDLYAAIDLAVDRLEGQMRKLKAKLNRRDKTSLGDNMNLEILQNDEKVYREDIVRHKKVELAPMDASEAITRMEALGHTFFIFMDSETGHVSIVYERKSGGYGLIESD